MALKMGVKWCKSCKHLAYKEEWEEEDKKSKKDNTDRTAEVIKEMMNSIDRNIQVTVETPNNFEDKTLPILDIRCWVEPLPEMTTCTIKPRQKLLYSFFSKPMSSKLCMMKRSAIPEKMKEQTLSNDCVRRMKNVSEYAGQMERDRVTDEYASMLLRSGYSREKSKEVIIAGLLGYERIKKLEEQGKGRIHRSSGKSLHTKYKKKVVAKNTWYLSKKEKGEKEEEKSSNVAWRRSPPRRKNPNTKKNDLKKNQQVTDPRTVSVLFVPQTVGGELARRLKAAEEELSVLLKDKVKIVEQTGKTLKSVLVKADPSSAASCGRDKCVICLDEKQRGTCKVRSVTYQTSCQTCTGQGREAVYIGESSRSVYERSLEHLEDYKKQREESHMYTHAIEAHSMDEKPLFNIKVLKNHRSALYRQVHEAVLIAKHHPITLNSKIEYNRCLLPRLTVMMGRKNVEDTENVIVEEKPSEEEKTLELNNKRRKTEGPEKPPRQKKRKIEILKHKKISELLRSQVEKSPRKRKRSDEDDEKKADQTKVKTDPDSASVYREKTAQTNNKVDRGGKVAKADPHSTPKEMEKAKKKTDPSSAPEKFTSRTTPENKTPTTLAEKTSANSDYKAPTSRIQNTPFSSYFYRQKVIRNSNNIPMVPKGQKLQKLKQQKLPFTSSVPTETKNILPNFQPPDPATTAKFENPIHKTTSETATSTTEEKADHTTDQADPSSTSERNTNPKNTAHTPITAQLGRDPQ